MIGKVIQERRKALNLTQSQVADYLGVSAPAVNKWEKNMCYPDASLLAPLARLLQIDLNELFSFYTVLSDQDRKAVKDKLYDKLMNENSSAVKAYAKEVTLENPSDGLLFKEVAETLFGFYALQNAAKPGIYLEEIAEYFNRAMELLDDDTDDIAMSLMNVYSEMGDPEKAESSWDKIRSCRHEKDWAHAEMQKMLGNYEDSAAEAKGIILRKIMDLSFKLDFLSMTLKRTGDLELAELAKSKSSELCRMFELWDGVRMLNDISITIDEADADGEVSGIADFVYNGAASDAEFSKSPLFRDVKLGKEATGNDSTADLMSDLLNTLKKLEAK